MSKGELRLTFAGINWSLTAARGILHSSYFQELQTRFGSGGGRSECDIEATVVGFNNQIPYEGPDPRTHFRSLFGNSAEKPIRIAIPVNSEAPSIELSVMLQVRLTTSLLLHARGGILLHSSAAIIQEKGMVFFGAGGGGKTTLARLLQSKAVVLNDECNAVIPTVDGYRIYSTPFTRPQNVSLCTAGGAPLNAVFKLRKAEENLVSPMRNSERFRCIVGSAYSTSCSQSESNPIDICQRISEKVPGYELSFRNDDSAADFLYNLVGGELGV